MTIDVGIPIGDALIKVGMEDLGIQEWPGAKHNPAVIAFGKQAGIDWFTKDEIPWCAIWVNAKLAEVGVPGTVSAMAKSFLKWGRSVPINEARPGDIAVTDRGSDPAAGHVFIIAGINGNTVEALGGNQGNSVSIVPNYLSKIISVRRWDGVMQSNRPTLRQGAKGPFVTDLQSQLRDLRYFAGAVDGHFGPLTETAVLAFQAANNLTTDGVVGAKTWKTIESAEPRPERSGATISGLRSRGSRTVTSADAGQAVATVSLGSLGLKEISSAVTEIKSTVQEATDTVQNATSLIPTDAIPHLAMFGVALVAGLVIWKVMSDVKKARLDDAVTGKNLGR